MSRISIFMILTAIVSGGHAESFEGRIIHIADGDTVTLLTAQNESRRIRLANIDAPEKAQPYGQRSRRHLEELVQGQQAVADCPKTDRYGRLVCTVTVVPPDCRECRPRDVGLAQLEAGLAWWYRAYAREQAADDRVRYEAAEDQARAARSGLWREPEPQAPWTWRRERRGGLR